MCYTLRSGSEINKTEVSEMDINAIPNQFDMGLGYSERLNFMVTPADVEKLKELSKIFDRSMSSTFRNLVRAAHQRYANQLPKV